MKSCQKSWFQATIQIQQPLGNASLQQDISSESVRNLHATFLSYHEDRQTNRQTKNRGKNITFFFYMIKTASKKTNTAKLTTF